MRLAQALPKQKYHLGFFFVRKSGRMDFHEKQVKGGLLLFFCLNNAPQANLILAA